MTDDERKPARVEEILAQCQHLGTVAIGDDVLGVLVTQFARGKLGLPDEDKYVFVAKWNSEPLPDGDGEGMKSVDIAVYLRAPGMTNPRQRGAA